MDLFHRGDHTYISRGTLTVMEPHKIYLVLPVIAKCLYVIMGLKHVLCLKEEARFYSEMLLYSAEVLWDLCDKNKQTFSGTKLKGTCKLLEDCPTGTHAHQVNDNM